MNFRSAVLAAFLFLLAYIPVHAEDGARVILVLDASGSMWGQIDGKSKMEIAKEVVGGQGNTNESGAANFPLGASTAMGPAQDTYDTMLARTATTFLGISAYDCVLCHNGRGHLTLTSAWGVSRTRTEAQQMAAFFSRMRFNPGADRSFDVVENADGAYDLNTNSGNRPDRLPLAGAA